MFRYLSDKIQSFLFHSPCFGEFIQKALHLVDTDGQVPRVAQPLPLGYTLEYVGEIVDELGKGDGHPLVHFGRLWYGRGGGWFGTTLLQLVRHVQRFLCSGSTQTS